MTNKEIRNKLEELSDEKYRQFHSSLCPKSNSIILGVRVPVLRKFAREIAEKENIEEYLANALDNSYEEILLQAMVLGHWKTDIETFCKYLEKFIPKIDNWAICDICATNFKITKENRKYMWNFLQKYLIANDEFQVRFAIVMMLDYYVIDEYIDKVLEQLNKIKSDKYYVKMAIAWCIQVSFIKFPEKTIAFLESCGLDFWTYNRALQKIIESNQVDAKTKEIIRSMKK